MKCCNHSCKYNLADVNAGNYCSYIDILLGYRVCKSHIAWEDEVAWIEEMTKDEVRPKRVINSILELEI